MIQVYKMIQNKSFNLIQTIIIVLLCKRSIYLFMEIIMGLQFSYVQSLVKTIAEFERMTIFFDFVGHFIGKLSTLERKLHSKSKQRVKEGKTSM